MKHWNNVSNRFKVNNKDTRMTTAASIVKLWTYLAFYSIFIIGEFEKKYRLGLINPSFRQ